MPYIIFVADLLQTARGMCELSEGLFAGLAAESGDLPEKPRWSVAVHRQIRNEHSVAPATRLRAGFGRHVMQGTWVLRLVLYGDPGTVSKLDR